MQDLLFHDATVVTMDRTRSVLDHTSVAVRDGRIIEVGPAVEMRKRYAASKTVEKLGLLGPDTIFSHCTGISERAIGIMRDSGTHAAHHPRAARIYTYPGRCPVPELIDAGVTVALGSDAPSTHNCDMFLDMKAAIDQQRIHFKDAGVLPPGKVLEMATIDEAAVLERVQAVYARFIERAGLAPLTANGERFWGVSRSG